MSTSVMKVLRAPSTRVRTVAGSVLLALLVPLLVFLAAPVVHAAGDDDKAANNYSLYHLASNASTYFSQKISVENSDQTWLTHWGDVVKSPASAGSLIGYADDKNFVGWLFSTVSGASQTIKWDALPNTTPGMKSYAEFGAANADLGLDKMHSAAGFDMVIHPVGGSLIWLAYALSMSVSILFWIFIQILKMLNPFMWFGRAVTAINPKLGEGMTHGGNSTLVNDNSPLASISTWISDWYGTLVSMSWGVLVPLFVGFLLLGLVFFKKMDRGSAFKKLVVRLLFIGLGLPLFGSMYTGILNQFDSSLLAQSAGPTKVVTSTYVDFENWMNKDRLRVPDNASITWDEKTGHAQPISTFSVRNTALAINQQTGLYPGITAGGKVDSAKTAWDTSTPSIQGSTDDSNAVLATLNMLTRYISSQTVSASDFESKIQGSISDVKDVKTEDKAAWFVGKSYKNPADNFGEGARPMPPTEHPLFATKGGAGLTSTAKEGKVEFTSTNGTTNCGYSVVDGGKGSAPADCNMSPLAAFNYLNTTFDGSAGTMTVYSSAKSSSDFTRAFHSSVAQVGTGPAAFMYWASAFTLLGSLAVLGFTYGVGMLTGSLRRGLSAIAAVPFATLGSISAIAKFIGYAVAMILEVLVAIFLYQFVSEFLVALPGIVEKSPMLSFVTDKNSIFSNEVLGSVAIIVLTLVSIVLVIGITITALRVRKSVLKAMDEAVTKLIDKFLETNTPPKAGSAGETPSSPKAPGAPTPGKSSGGVPQMNGSGKAGGHGNNAQGRGPGGSRSNAGGTNGDAKKPKDKSTGGRDARNAAGSGDRVGGGEVPTSSSPSNPSKARGGNRRGGTKTGASNAGGSSGAVPRSGAGRGSTSDQGMTINVPDSAGQGSRSLDDRQLAHKVAQQGGLTNLGVAASGAGLPQFSRRQGRVSTSAPSQDAQPRQRRNVPGSPDADRPAPPVRLSRPRPPKPLSKPVWPDAAQQLKKEKK